MQTFSFKDKVYNLGAWGFLINPDEWDEDFAIGMAPKLGITNGLSAAHWAVILFIRESFQQTGRCPFVFQTCKSNELTSTELSYLFPSGYLRGACLLAGITYKNRIVSCLGESVPDMSGKEEKIYQIDQNGFLVNPLEWDKQYAINKALEMKMPGGLTEKHWKIINYLRDRYRAAKSVPTVFQCCEENNIEMDDLAALFPDGYQRGAVKISGLRVI
ncbi:MAG: TusE/DsrC/DsvC family sulfur relay protein [Desulfobacteraceae bacterium]|nr:TusE/DsrC/DsvC family sulfur relay protein [Desulfobacteraceae bacterium]MBC2756120.1 TusE/DsrC/DsvC family sulfur relay protein [Desulfobacteraceae bacterium]